jgi:hypothetical protein
MKWYKVHFDATKSDPDTYVRRVTIDEKVQAESPYRAIEQAVINALGYGYILASVEDGTTDNWIPVEWEFEDYLLWVDEGSATLAGMVSELSPAEELRMLGVPTLFDEVTT